MEEKLYKKMKSVGVSNLVFGIVTIAFGIGAIAYPPFPHIFINITYS